MKAWSKRELLGYLDRVLPALDELNHYELLDVALDADENSIQKAFHAMAAGLHPDRHRNVLSPEQHENLITVYARIAEAYRVLRDESLRQKYSSGLARHSTKVPPSQSQAGAQNSALALLSPKAQRLYRRAMASLRTGDVVSAQLNLKMALAKHPQSDFLRESLKQLLSKGAQP